MIARPIERRASDIHIEPFEKEFRVRFRVDACYSARRWPPRELKGRDHQPPEADGQAQILRTGLPQDGRIRSMIWARGGPSRFHPAHAYGEAS